MSQFRNRGSMVRKSGTRDMSNLPPLQNIVVMLDEFAFEQKGKSNPEKDYAYVYLTHDVPELGLTAAFAEDGAPATRIRLEMPLPKGGADNRRDLLGLSQKKAGGAAMSRGSLFVAEKTWFVKGKGDQVETLKAHYSRGGPTAEDQAKDLKQLYSNIYACVLPERSYKQGNDTVYRQDVMIADQLGAQLVTDEAGLRAAIETAISNTRIGTGGFQLHARAVAPETLSDEQRVAYDEQGNPLTKLAFASNPNTRVSGFVVAKPKMVEENGTKTWVALTVDEVLDKLWKSSDLSAVWGQEGYQFEFIPMMQVNQAGSLIPSNKNNNKGKDNSKIYALYDYQYDNNGNPVVDAAGQHTVDLADYGWAMSHTIVERMAEDSHSWYSTYQNPVSTRAQVFALPDIPTPHMPDYHLAAVQAEAVRLGENKRAYFAARKQADPTLEGETPAPGPR